jgi:hypothetical protein
VVGDEQRGDPYSASTGFWVWLAVLIVLFMGVIVVMALIQSQAP